MSPLALTQHAAARARQRGVPDAVIHLVLDHADLATPVGSGCSALRLSRRCLDDRDLRRRLNAHLDRAGRLTLVVDDLSGEVVTVLHDHGGRRGRRYRRG